MQRKRFLEWLILILFIFFILLPIGDTVLAIFLFDDVNIGFMTIPLYELLTIIITLIVLTYMKKNHSTLFKILVIFQLVLWIPFFIILIDSYVHALVTIILIFLSLYQIINAFFSSTTQLKVASIITTTLFVIGIGLFSVLFWTVSRFEYRLNENGDSYSIERIRSDIPIIRIPSTYRGLPVTRINAYYEHYNYIREIIFEEDCHIEVIDDWSNGCGKLRKITLPSSLHTIDDFAFSSCYNLEEVYIPIGVTIIGTNAFQCENATIYCEAESKLEAWNVNWCSEAKVIIWGYRKS